MAAKKVLLMKQQKKFIASADIFDKMERIVDYIENFYAIPENITNKSRFKPLPEARGIAIYLMHRNGIRFCDIARRLQLKDATVNIRFKSVVDELKYSPLSSLSLNLTKISDLHNSK